MSQREVRPLTVRLGAAETETWSLEVEPEPYVWCRMRLQSVDGSTWSADGDDAFDCLCQIRIQVEPDGIRLCCNGSRRDAWLSGMLRDMGDGRVVYLMDSASSDDTGRPQQVAVLDAAPPDEVVSLTEQLDHLAARMGWGETTDLDGCWEPTDGVAPSPLRWIASRRPTVPRRYQKI